MHVAAWDKPQNGGAEGLPPTRGIHLSRRRCNCRGIVSMKKKKPCTVMAAEGFLSSFILFLGCVGAGC